MKKIISIFVLITALYACEKEDRVVYDVDNGQTMISWKASSENVDLPVLINSTGSVTLAVDVTTRSSAVRSFPVTVVTEETEADPNSYSFEGTVNIPANSFNGELVIEGTDVNVEIEPKTLVLTLESGPGYIVGTRQTAEISIFQICPVPEDFLVGQYEITVLQPGVFGVGTFGPTGTVVTIASNGLQRSFTANYFNDSRFPRTFEFTLTCGEINVPRVDQRVGCGGNSVNLVTGPPSGTSGTYDLDDDSSFTINLTDNVDSDCGGSPVQASYRFDKVD